MKRFILGFFLVILATSIAMAQTTTGRLSGTVSGPDGVLPGATITATDVATGKSQTTVSNGEGAYSFPQLEFGTYTVKVTSAGFKAYVASSVKIDVGRDYSLSPALEVGAIEETVTVTAGADVITANTAQVSNTISPQQILSLPLLTRSPLSLTTLQAGVASNSAANTTINGMRTTFTNITRDGINIQDTYIRSNATDFAPGRPSVDDTAEFTITTTNSEADQGSGGAQIRLVTPRGTKDFHGALFAYNRNSAFAANSFFNNRSRNADGTSNMTVAKKPSFRNRNQFGGKISGPMPVPGFGEGTPVFFKDRGYFFFAYEGIRDPLSTAASRTILTPGARNGAFSWNRTNGTDISPYCASQTVGSVCTIPNILTFARSFGGNFLTIPAVVDPIIQSRVISLLPASSNFTGGDGLNTAGYRFLRRSDQTRDQYSSRFDVDLSENDSILGVYNYNKESNLRPDADTTAFTVIPQVNQLSVNKQLTLAWRHVFSSNFVNEFRGGIFTSEVPFDKTDATPAYYFALPLVTNPENTFLSQGRNTKAFNFQSNADYIWKSHTIRFGGQAQIFRVNAYNDAAIVPTVSLSNTNTGVALATTNFAGLGGISTGQLGSSNGMLALFGGVFNSVAQSFNIADVSRGFEAGVRQYQPFRNENHAVYLSDRWAVTRNLTLSLGMRYELFPGLRINNGLALEPLIPDAANMNSSLLSLSGTSGVVGTNSGRKNAYYKTDYNNLAPNLGISWSPSYEKGLGKFLFGGAGKSVLRGGYSQIYGNDSIITSINNAAVGNPGLARTAVSLLNLNGRVSTAIPTVAPPTFITPPRTWLQNNAVGVGNFFGTVFAIDPELKSPRVDQYSFGFQREFFGNTAFEARYVGSRSGNLVRGIDINQVDIMNNGFFADFERARANFALTGNAFCAIAGCQALTIFQSGAGSAGRLGVGTGGLALATFNSNLQNGTPADLALSYINNTTNLNNHPSSANPTLVPFVRLLPNPAAGAIDVMLNDANYRYNSLQLEIRRRFTSGLYFQANYTFSKNLTNAVGTSQALFEPYLDNNRKELDNSRADYDQTHVFNFNGVYQMPFGKGKMFINKGGIADKVFGGWEVSGLMQWTSGAPITFVDTRGTYNRSGRSARQTPYSSLTNDEIRALMGTFELNNNIYWINPSIISAQGAASNGFGTSFAGQVFSNVNPGQTGNIGRAIVNGPKYLNVNAALLKNIRFTESIRVQIRAEAFNLLNNVNFVQNTTLPNINSSSFGQITGEYGPRTMQFAARFEF
ncbi:MAG TPA: TonB-dependent receptor [Pyrinomonadaceae bacterium]|nr:carboxypeptidase regulatory-like domain-containing protein [Chloracidobacterium sp.]MBP9935108.1 carboxypeptidase regulatory-like domain-containing protein [Pyrinomonadaceae bacterium]HQX54896.1 TonB-dependent receptor [Pyrinomonadaceae bacterium]HQY66639.1 TonB-dependent receptor [Pyrinomonadaceae bacterium]